MSAKKLSKLIINITTCISILIAFFVTDYYPRHIILYDKEFSLVNTIYNFVLNFIFSVILINIFSLCSSVFSNNAFHLRDKKERNKVILRVFAILAIQVICDTILAFVITMDGCSYIWTDTVLILQWVAIYFILINKELLKNKKHNIAVVIFFVVIFAFSFAWDISKLESYRILTQKYTVDSPYIIRFVRNTDFIYSVKTNIADIAIICGLILIHGICNRSVKCEDDGATQNVGIPKTLLRIGIIVNAIAIIAVVKIAVFPQSFFVWGENARSAHMNYREDGEFNITCDDYTAQRGFGTTSLENSEYSERYITLQKGRINVSFLFNGQENEFVLTGNGTALTDCYEFIVDSQKVYLYGNYAIAYYEKAEPKLIKINDLNDFGYNAVVIGLCEQLIENGNIFLFEYGAKFLLKFDEDFIIPYIERYARGEFNYDELNWIETSYYRKDYIVNKATMLKRINN